jgi:hypothetical protein
VKTSPSVDEELALLLSLAGVEVVVVVVFVVGELDALVLLVFDELVFVSDLEHPAKSAAARPSAKIGFNVFTKLSLSKYA